MVEPWTHIGRLWSNGEPFLAIDARLRGAWLGYSNDDFDRIVDLGAEPTGLPVGTVDAALIGGDGVVRDDSWIEVFESGHGAIAAVQASGEHYRQALFEPARPGPVPAEHGWPTPGEDPGLLIPTGGRTRYAFRVRWYTKLDDGESCFARWLLLPG